MKRFAALVLVMLLAACSSGDSPPATPGEQAGPTIPAPASEGDPGVQTDAAAPTEVAGTSSATQAGAGGTPPAAGEAPPAVGASDGPTGTAPVTSPPQPGTTAGDAPAGGAAPAPPPAPTGPGQPAPPPPSDGTPAGEPAPADAGGSPDEVVVGEVDDPSGDAGLTAPPYADLAAVTVFGRADLATVVITLAAPLPDALADGEVMGIGVDFYSDAGDQESDYQLFALGNADGWRAFLSDANGSYDLPGEFRLDGDVLGFQLPWFNLGDLPSGGFSAFLDWSQPGLAINESAADGAPDDGLGGFQR